MTKRLPRTAIVTGAARGIGRAIALRLGRDGFNVAVLDLYEAACRDVAVEIESTSGMKTLAVTTDVTDEQSVTAALQRIVEDLGVPTALVNNAGIIRDNLVYKMTVDDWDAVLSVHLRGAFLMSKATQNIHA